MEPLTKVQHAMGKQIGHVCGKKWKEPVVQTHLAGSTQRDFVLIVNAVKHLSISCLMSSDVGMPFCPVCRMVSDAAYSLKGKRVSRRRETPK
jgi:hypothetical protein